MKNIWNNLPLLIVLYCLSLDQVTAFTPANTWALTSHTTGDDTLCGLAYDAQENAIQVGGYYNTATQSRDLLIQKIDKATGLALWTQTFGGAGLDQATAVCSDNSSNIYVTGSFSGVVNFGCATLAATGASDIFVMKLNSSGICQWARRMGGFGMDQGTAVGYDVPSGALVVAGYFTGTGIDFGNSNFLLSSAGYTDLFVARYNGFTGAYQWAWSYGTSDNSNGDFATDLDINAAGDIIISGNISALSNSFSCTGNPTPMQGVNLVVNSNSVRDVDPVIIEINASGSYRSSWRGLGTGSCYANAIKFGPGGSVYMAGTYNGGDFDFGCGALANPTLNGSNDGYLVKFNPGFACPVPWIKVWVGLVAERAEGGYGLDVDGAGNAYVAGYVTDVDATIYPGTHSSTSVYPGQVLNSDAFLLKYTSGGSFVTAETYGSTNAGVGGYDQANQVCVTPSGAIYLNGVYGVKLPTGARPVISFGSNQITSTGNVDGFITLFNGPLTPTLSCSTASVTNPSSCCQSNGQICVAATGGSGNYSYQWSNGLSGTGFTCINAGVGSYTCTITDLSTGASCTIPTVQLTSSTPINLICSLVNNQLCVSGVPAGCTVAWTNQNNPGVVLSNNICFTPPQAGFYVCTVSSPCGVSTCSAYFPGILTCSISTIVSPSSCCSTDGQLCVTASNGTGNYTYQWSNGGTTACVFGLTASSTGTAYSVSVTDLSTGQTCADSRTILPQPVSMSLSCSKVNVSCFGQSNGSATASVISYSPQPACAVSYVWRNQNNSIVSNTATANNLPVGTYTVTATSCGTQATCSVTITQPPLLNCSTNATPVLCFGGSSTVTVTATGGTPGYNGTGNFTAFAGTRSYTVTDANGCFTTCTATITQPTQLALTVATTPDLFRTQTINEGTAAASVSGGVPPYSYLWSTGETSSSIANLRWGSYSVLITDANGCTASLTFNVGKRGSCCGGRKQCVPTCSDLFYDSGDISNDYSFNSNDTVTFCADSCGKRMLADFSVFELGAGDTLWAYDGAIAGAVLLGYRTQLDTAPVNFVSNAACITFVFTSDGIDGGRGWEASVVCVDDSDSYCMSTADTIYTCTGNFYDSGAGLDYSNNENRITTFCSDDPSLSIEMYFDTFNLGIDDHLLVYDGIGLTAPLLGDYTATNLLDTISATGRCLTFQFVSDAAITAFGWESFISCVPGDDSHCMGNDTLVTTCSGFFFDSGNSSGDYANLENDTITFCSANVGEAVSFDFTTFQLDPADRLSVYDGNSTSGAWLGDYTGFNSPGIITSSGSCMTFVFNSDSTGNDIGWSASISCETPGCASYIYYDGTSFQSSSSAALTYHWLCNGDTIPGATSSSYDPVQGQACSYQLVTSSASGCVDTSNALVWPGISEIDPALQEISLYPNPADHEFVLDLPPAIWLQADLYTVDGRHISSLFNGQTSTSKERVIIPSAELSQGVYVVRLASLKGGRTLRLVVLH